MVIFKGVNFYPRQIETLLLRSPASSHEYQIVLDSDGGGERLTLVVETEPGCDAGRRRAHPARGARRCSASAPEVRLCALGTIERAAGQVGARRRPPRAMSRATSTRCSRRARSPCSASRAIPASSAIACSQNVQGARLRGRRPSRESVGRADPRLRDRAGVDALPRGRRSGARQPARAPRCPEAITALAARGVRAAVILSSGFGEVDADGRDDAGRRCWPPRARPGCGSSGPNCMGVYSAPARLNGTYFWDLPAGGRRDR